MPGCVCKYFTARQQHWNTPSAVYSSVLTFSSQSSESVIIYRASDHVLPSPFDYPIRITCPWPADYSVVHPAHARLRHSRIEVDEQRYNTTRHDTTPLKTYDTQQLEKIGTQTVAHAFTLTPNRSITRLTVLPGREAVSANIQSELFRLTAAV